MKKRRNADDALRKLERKAFETYDASDIAAYWRAALRSGEIPKANFSFVSPAKDNRYWDRAKDAKNSMAWSLYDVRSREHGPMPSLPRVVVSSGRIFTYPEHIEYLDLAAYDKTATKELLVKALNMLLEIHEVRSKFNPRKKRRNADDALRAAERTWLADPSEENTARYWKACLRAKEIPLPNLSLEMYKTWYFGPEIKLTNVVTLATKLTHSSGFLIWGPAESPLASRKGVRIASSEEAYEYVRLCLKRIMEKNGY